MKTKLTVCIILTSLMMTSCGLLDKLGFDTYDYMREEISAVHEVESEKAEELEDLLDILVTDSPNLPTFEKMGDAIKSYRDAVLSYMLDAGYSKYSGNTELIEKASKEYPEYNITQIIPKNEFEATMYRYFGGDVMITHSDGEKFKYLPAIGAYISSVAPGDSGFYAEITYLAETEKTYRINFKVKSEQIESDEYFALVIKRDDGTLYVKKLLNSSDVK
ncbi:MAG: hypothetical protein E7672_07130 [Ruminococcaceae bacterium]|nr:hypothetical protein [Oscillospiraceae bacterium]